MTATYVLPIALDRDRIRARIGDTNVTTTKVDERLEDEEIAFALEECAGALDPAAIYAAEMLLAKLSRLPDEIKVGPYSEAYKSRIASLQATITMLRRRAGSSGMPYVGGISRTRAEESAADEDLPQLSFSVGQFDRDGANNGELKPFES